MNTYEEIYKSLIVKENKAIEKLRKLHRNDNYITDEKIYALNNKYRFMKGESK